MKKFILFLFSAFLIIMLSTGICWAKPGHNQGAGAKNNGKPGKSSLEENVYKNQNGTEEESEENIEFITEEGIKVEIKNGKIEIKDNESKFEMKNGKVEYKSPNGKYELKKNKVESKGNILEEFKEKLQFYEEIIQQNGIGTENNFTDVQNHWAEQAINSLTAINLLNGYEDHTFKPDEPVSQAETLALLMRLVPEDEEGSENEAPDENEENVLEEENGTEQITGEEQDQELEPEGGIEGEENEEEDAIPGWAQKEIDKAARKGIVNMNRFHSHVQTTRAMAAVWVAKTLGIEPIDVSDITFKDDFLISREYVGYIKALAEEGIIVGTPDGKFNPNSAVTRAQLAAIIERILTEQENEDSANTGENEEPGTEDENTTTGGETNTEENDEESLEGNVGEGDQTL